MFCSFWVYLFNTKQKILSMLICDVASLCRTACVACFFVDDEPNAGCAVAESLAAGFHQHEKMQTL